MTEPITLTREVGASPSDVFASWTSAESLARWWWPHIADATYEVDAVVGGSYRIASDQYGIGVEGEFVTIEEPGRLEFTWRWQTDGVDEPEESVQVIIAGTPAGSTLTVTHHLAPRPDDGADTRRGWEDVLDRLVAHHAAP